MARTLGLPPSDDPDWGTDFIDLRIWWRIFYGESP